MRDAEELSNFRSSTVKLNGRPSPALANHLDLEPTDPLAYSRSEGFRGCLLGGETRSEAFSGVALAEAVGLFRRGINPVEESFPIAVYRLLDALNFRQIDSRTNNHPAYQAT